MALALTEVFTGNKDTCLKIRAQEVYAVMKLVAEHKEDAPELIDLLNAIVKVLLKWKLYIIRMLC